MDISSVRIAHLSRQRNEMIVEYRHRGAEAGQTWADTAPYGSLEYAAKVFLTEHETGATASMLLDDVILGDYWAAQFHAQPELLQSKNKCDGDPRGGPTCAGHAWLKGWFDQVIAYWDEIERKMK